MKKKVVVGMSGGVDSSVCAYLLKEQGYDVTGVTMRLWEDEEEVCRRAGHVGCCGASAVEDAKEVCAMLGIPFHVASLQDEFKEKVIDYFCDSYIRGITPNPCIACNFYMKWGAMLDMARRMGADYIATGHYAGVARLKNGRYAIRNSKTAAKDQTYALYPLTQEMLAHTIMPIGAYTKDEVRAIARRASLPVAAKRDSQDICFVPDGDYAAFLEQNVCACRIPGEGNFVDAAGNILGRHRGITHYTIGQRRGLDIALGKRVFVNEIRADSHEVVLGEDEDCYSDGLTASRINHMGCESFDASKEYIAKIRYSDSGSPCHIEYINDDRIRIVFDRRVRAVTPGQAVVIYEDDYVAGGGIIECAC